MSLNYIEKGEGEIVIVLHGLFGMLDNWKTLANSWSENYKVVLIDQRNHGRSFHSEEMDYYLLADDIVELLSEKEWGAVHVLGHSMGGKTAMQLAMNAPNLVRSLTVVDIAPKDYPPGHESIFEAFESVPIATLESRKQAAAAMKQIVEDDGVIMFLLKNLSRSGGSYSWKANIAAIKEAYPEVIANSLSPWDVFDGPTLFIKGGNSERYIEEEDRDLITAHFPEARIETVEGAGHWVHAEKPQELSELFMGFLSTLGDFDV